MYEQYIPRVLSQLSASPPLLADFEGRFARQDVYLRTLEDDMKTLKNNFSQNTLEVTKAAIKDLIDSAHAEISQCCRELVATNAKQLVEFYKEVRAAFRDLLDEEKASGSPPRKATSPLATCLLIINVGCLFYDLLLLLARRKAHRERSGGGPRTYRGHKRGHKRPNC